MFIFVYSLFGFVAHYRCKKALFWLFKARFVPGNIKPLLPLKKTKTKAKLLVSGVLQTRGLTPI
jgi:hypothetical protein